ncbi:MAG TPA: hypothetical protein PK349_04170, partial [Candidatus Hydrogenedentes bacterium]|nr:hypothetical protein [Candidatus Hydrogenedentota bacterium]
LYLKLKYKINKNFQGNLLLLPWRSILNQGVHPPPDASHPENRRAGRLTILCGRWKAIGATHEPRTAKLLNK